MAMKVPFYLQWWAIILGFILFWPIGLALLIWRITRSRKLMLKSGNAIRIIGIIILVFFALVTLGVIVDPEAGFDVFIVFCIFFFLPGFLLYRYGRKLRMESNMTKEYIQLIVNEHYRSVEEIARRRQMNPAQVRDDLNKLIEKNFLPNATLNQQTDRIEFLTAEEPNRGQDTEETSNASTEAAATKDVSSTKAPASKPKSVTCSGCGANNMLTAGSGECEYCGTSLTA